MVVKKRLIALALALMLCAGLGAQGVKVLSSVNKNVISMAEQLQLTLKIRSDHSLRLSAPPAPQVPGITGPLHAPAAEPAATPPFSAAG